MRLLILIALLALPQIATAQSVLSTRSNSGFISELTSDNRRDHIGVGIGMTGLIQRDLNSQRGRPDPLGPTLELGPLLDAQINILGGGIVIDNRLF
ncbi:MAG: hypothetical protein AAGE76_06865 [Pseudomonadota bacterium]